MENVCPSCGKLINSGCQAFDLTRFMGQQLITYMDIKLADMDEDERNSLINGMETLFNEALKKPVTRLIFKESELWNKMPEDEVFEATGKKTCFFAFPYDKIRFIFSALERKDASVRAAYDWYDNNEALIKEIVSRLYYESEGVGDVRIDSIRDGYDKSSVVSIRVCPHCGDPLSHWAGRYPEITIGVLGSPRISKTATICAMAAKFKGTYKGISWQRWNDKRELTNSFEDSYLKTYKEGRPIPATETRKNNISRLSYRVKLENGKYATMTFVDLPGENMDKDDNMARDYTHYYHNVDCIWYLTDIAELRQPKPCKNDLGRDERTSPKSKEAILTHMQKVTKYFDGREDIYAAYILGKTDSELISKQDKNRYELFSETESGDLDVPFDVNEFAGKSFKVKEYMESIDHDFVDQFKETFPNRGFFAMSAYGFDPYWNIENNDPPLPPKPYGCAAPFLWALACMGYIKVKVNYTKYKRALLGFGKTYVEELNEEDYPENITEFLKEGVKANLFMKNDSPVDFTYNH